MENDFEVVIIGGGPAGSAAAVYLQQSGFNVCLIEKKKFPRETLCGEFLSLEVIKAIAELNLSKKFFELKPNPINSFRFIDDNEKELVASFDFNAFGLKRGAFDEMMLNAAKDAGAVILQPAEVKFISKEGNKFTLSVKTDVNNEISISPKYLIAAYGKQNVLDKDLGRSFWGHKSRLNGVKFHIKSEYLKNFIKNEIRIYAAEGIYCGVNAVNDETVTFCFLEDRGKIEISPREHLVRLTKENLKFSQLFAGNITDILENLPLYGTGNIFFGKRDYIKNNIYMIGDAAGVIAPLAGDGIGMAFESAKLAANILSDVKTGRINFLSAFQVYEKEWGKKFRKRLTTALLIQKGVMNKFSRRAGVVSVQLFPVILKGFIQSTRSSNK